MSIEAAGDNPFLDKHTGVTLDVGNHNDDELSSDSDSESPRPPSTSNCQLKTLKCRLQRERESSGFWNHAWTVDPQVPRAGPFNQYDIKWSYYDGDAFVWIPANRVNDFINGEQSNQLAPATFKHRIRKHQKWTSNTPCRVNHYVNRTVYACQYGPKKTTFLKDIPNRRRVKVGRKTGCQCSFIVCIMRSRYDLACILYKINEHIDKDGNHCHGILASLNDLRIKHPIFLLPKMKENIESFCLAGHSVNIVYEKFLYDLFKDPSNREFAYGSQRVLYMLRKDVLDIYQKVVTPGFQLHENENESVRLWNEKCSDFIFFYQKMNEDADIPLIIGLQSSWMLKNMVEYSHNGILAINSILNKNRYKYTLHTVLAYDSFYNVVPVAWIISSRRRTVDIELWLTQLKLRCRNYDPNWKVNSFLMDDSIPEIEAVCNVIGCRIFLCTWHICRSWRKNLMAKVKDQEVRAKMIAILSKILNSSKQPLEIFNGLDKFVEEFKDQKNFTNYLYSHWLKKEKYYMWEKMYSDVYHAQQHTNIAIESYHGFLKGRFLGDRKKDNANRVDWLIWCLSNAQLHYWNMTMMKEDGFIMNKRVREDNKQSWERGILINDDNCKAVQDQEDAYFVKSQNEKALNDFYLVSRAFSHGITCECVWACKGHICKHAVKVLVAIKGIEGAHKFLFEKQFFDPEKQMDLADFVQNHYFRKKNVQELPSAELPASLQQRLDQHSLANFQKLSTASDQFNDLNDPISMNMPLEESEPQILMLCQNEHIQSEIAENSQAESGTNELQALTRRIRQRLNYFMKNLPADLDQIRSINIHVDQMISKFANGDLKQTCSKKRLSHRTSSSMLKKKRRRDSMKFPVSMDMDVNRE